MASPHPPITPFTIKYNVESGVIPAALPLNGIGITPEYQKDIFRLFKRLPTSQKYNPSGTGAGLALVKKLVGRCNGRIWLESEPDKGTTFYFTAGKCTGPS